MAPCVPLSSEAFPSRTGEGSGDELVWEEDQEGPRAAFVRTVREPGKYFDGHGLYLRVDPNGYRFWVQRIAIRGKRTELGLGSPSLVTLAEAREAALANRKMARAGGDPLAARRATSAILTFEEATREVYRLHLPTWRSAKHATQYIASLENYAFPRLGAVRVSDITSGDVLSVLSPIWVEKPQAARRVRQRIGTVMKWARPKDGGSTTRPRI